MVVPIREIRNKFTSSSTNTIPTQNSILPTVYQDSNTVMDCYGTLWTLTFFFFLLSIFLILYFFSFEFLFLFLFINDEGARDIAVT